MLKHRTPLGGYITFDVLAPPPFNATFQLRGAEWEIGPVSAFSPGGLPVIFNNVRVRAFLNVISQESPDRFSHLVSFVPQGGVDPLDNEATNPAIAGPLAGAPGVLEARVELRPGGARHIPVRTLRFIQDHLHHPVTAPMLQRIHDSLQTQLC